MTRDHIAARLLRETQVHGTYGFSAPWLKKRRRLHLPRDLVRVGRTIYYERCVLEKFIANHRVAPGKSEGK